ncbi:vacuolar membrane protein [Trichosporon asahii var. asahii CBS 2479]|uniref:Vacuolar membrane protein n=1 Tax=Trichosporon asahii var. asahii (strain ATCC 90039 / CBS 2479 / JCM 2466 / KCTC 7840 / NBRC 103889/ NCYC 2677 / UAMH 7654) TaxID=1186058 RepID=J6F188_TRIAS|nr:vacuolar membrane protein [Trichosporon asahii var. asahii CBS 2479]EJT48922.1 vacuolar membrane protein [Trichosporon asahii var. asahii CBS 2479]
MLTVGGLLGSLLSDRVVRQRGIAGGIAASAWINLVGALVMALAPHWLLLMLGRPPPRTAFAHEQWTFLPTPTPRRLFLGMCTRRAEIRFSERVYVLITAVHPLDRPEVTSTSARTPLTTDSSPVSRVVSPVCLVPPYLAHTARSTPSLVQRSGQVGTLHQLAIVIGICSAQVLGMAFSGAEGDRLNAWRYILSISGIVSVAQIVMTTSTAKPDSEGVYVADAGLTAAEPLLAEDPERPATQAAESDQLSIAEMLASPARRNALFVTAILILQQLSGVNAVLFYSTPVLQKVLPSAGAGQISIAITVVNAIMTFPAIFLVDRLGRRLLLLLSSFLMMVFAILLGWGLNEHFRKMSSFAIVAFIAAFSIGLGPIPFLLVSEMVPANCVPALSSLALSASWITTFIIAQGFLPLRDALTYYDPNGHQEGEGRVFYVFAFNLAVLCVLTIKGVPKSHTTHPE